MRDLNKTVICNTKDYTERETSINVINYLLNNAEQLEKEFLIDNKESIEVDHIELYEDESGLEIVYTYNSTYSLASESWDSIEQLEKDIMINSLTNDTYRVKTDISMIDDSIVYSIYTGDHSKGIFTIMKSSNQDNIINKLERLLTK